MKKFLLIGLIVGLVLVLVGGAGAIYVSASNLKNVTPVTVITNQNGDRIVQPYMYGPGGMMNGYRYGPGGMMGGRGFNRGTGIMHEYIVTAFANAVGLTVDQVNTRLSNGETLVQIAEAQGFTGDKLTTLAKDVATTAVNQAVKDGVITQAQADNILQRIQNSTNFGFDFGIYGCPMWEGGEIQP